MRDIERVWFRFLLGLEAVVFFNSDLSDWALARIGLSFGPPIPLPTGPAVVGALIFGGMAAWWFRRLR